ncbi:hypothetical protein [Flavobacterium ginsengiterrae]|uniref:Uncharacterized protein n=1 Tax=Flavobacterium ginsengiterrae TaxID=871695 RepID=A0ABP7G343_9FLAO
MKKFEIKKTAQGSWMVSDNELPRFTCQFEERKFHYSRTITELFDPTGGPGEIKLPQRMEKWLAHYHMDKING